MKKLLLGILVGSFYYCNNETHVKKEEADTTAPTVTNTPPIAKDGDSIFSISSPNGNIALQQWDSSFNMEKEFGKPVRQSTIQLDEHSDTHAGSFVKKISYDGLKFQLFSPKQNGKHFWVQEIILNSPKYATSKGVKVGDSLSKVKQAYPDLQLFPGNTTDMFYINPGGNEKSIEFEIPKGKVKQIRLYYMIP
jgi:hypothetical protein